MLNQRLCGIIALMNSVKNCVKFTVKFQKSIRLHIKSSNPPTILLVLFEYPCPSTLSFLINPSHFSNYALLFCIDDDLANTHRITCIYHCCAWIDSIFRFSNHPLSLTKGGCFRKKTSMGVIDFVPFASKNIKNHFVGHHHHHTK